MCAEIFFLLCVQDLEDMSISFKQSNLSSTFSEKSDFDISNSTQTGMLPKSDQQRTGTLPPPPPSPPPQQQQQLTADVKSSGAVVSEPQFPTWSSERFFTESLDLPASPELTLNYSSLNYSSHTAAVKPSLSDTNAKSYPLAPGNLSSAFGIGYSVQPESSVTKYPSKASHTTGQAVKAAGEDRNILRSTENTGYPSTPEFRTGKRQGGDVLPAHPKLQHAVPDDDLSLPPTPKFMGSYHFMGGQH